MNTLAQVSLSNSAQSSTEFLLGAGVAALLLVAGLGLGIWLARRFTTAPKSEPQDLLQLLTSLSRWTNGFATDVSQMREVMDLAAQQMKNLSDSPQQPNGSANKLLEQVAVANDLLQKRITDAETTLNQQAQQITSYMNEARTDALTGVPNRRAFDDEFSRRMAEWRRHNTQFILIIFDIDHFKRVNDTYGHTAGDAALQQLATVLKDALRQTDVVCRYGGEEFTILLPGSGMKHAGESAERLRELVASTKFSHEGKILPVTISLGVAEPLTGDSPVCLLKRADEALYAAKKAGRNRSYWNDGQNCIPLAPGNSPADKPAASTESNSIAPSLSVTLDEPVSSSNFAQVCADLRRKLQEVTAK